MFSSALTFCLNCYNSKKKKRAETPVVVPVASSTSFALSLSLSRSLCFDCTPARPMKRLFGLVALSLAGALPGVQVSPVEIRASSSAGMGFFGRAEIWKFPAVASRMPTRFRAFRLVFESSERYWGMS